MWNDANGNGVQDPGEPGIGNVTLALSTAGADALCGTADDSAVMTTTTNANGHYLFENLATPAKYCVTVTDVNHVLDQYVLTGGSNPLLVDLPANGVNLDADFGYYQPQPGAIGDTVWNDANGDGVQDTGEPGIGNVTIALSTAGADALCGTADDSAVMTTTTDANGHYLFENLATPDKYCVTVTDANQVLTGYTLTGGSNPLLVDLPTNGINLAADFGYQPLASVTGVVFGDANQNGVYDSGESLLPGVTVCLYAAADPGTALSCVVTDSNGSYTFVGLPLGDYVVKVDPADAALPVGATPTTTTTIPVSLTQPGQIGHADFGFWGYAQPAVMVSKQLTDPVDGAIEVGDNFTFTVIITNSGELPLSMVPLSDQFGSSVASFVSANPAPDSTGSGTLTWTNLASSPLAVGDSITVRIVLHAELAVENSVNTATVSGAKSADGQTADPASDSVTYTIAPPTAVTLSAFTAAPVNGDILLRWTTSAEFDNWGFNVYRATVNNPTAAVKLNDILIPGQGQSVVGHDYTFTDSGVASGQTYWYWLEDVEFGGKRAMHGPVEVAVTQTNMYHGQPYQAFVPLATQW